MMTSFNNGNSALSDMGYSEPFIEAMAEPASAPTNPVAMIRTCCPGHR